MRFAHERPAADSMGDSRLRLGPQTAELSKSGDHRESESETARFGRFLAGIVNSITTTATTTIER
jgi:hypothetical protein